MALIKTGGEKEGSGCNQLLDMTKEQYQVYLQSPHWKQLRAEKWKRSHKRCGICGSKEQLQVHHMVYRQIYDVQLTDLRVLCDTCHETTHRLINAGRLDVRASETHNGWFQRTKTAVKMARGLRGNCFSGQ